LRNSCSPVYIVGLNVCASQLRLRDPSNFDAEARP
jgi:hypothetical protein